jgi:hypothetical protein
LPFLFGFKILIYRRILPCVTAPGHHHRQLNRVLNVAEAALLEADVVQASLRIQPGPDNLIKRLAQENIVAVILVGDRREVVRGVVVAFELGALELRLVLDHNLAQAIKLGLGPGLMAADVLERMAEAVHVDCELLERSVVAKKHGLGLERGGVCGKRGLGVVRMRGVVRGVVRVGRAGHRDAGFGRVRDLWFVLF